MAYKCSWCQEEIFLDDAVAKCTACGTFYHNDCLRELGGGVCGIAGCGSRNFEHHNAIEELRSSPGASAPHSAPPRQESRSGRSRRVISVQPRSRQASPGAWQWTQPRQSGALVRAGSRPPARSDFPPGHSGVPPTAMRSPGGPAHAQPRSSAVRDKLAYNLGLASLVCSILSLFCGVGAPLGVGLGIGAIKVANKDLRWPASEGMPYHIYRKYRTGKKMGIAGLAIGGVLTLGMITIFVLAALGA